MVVFSLEMHGLLSLKTKIIWRPGADGSLLEHTAVMRTLYVVNYATVHAAFLDDECLQFTL